MQRMLSKAMLFYTKRLKYYTPPKKAKTPQKAEWKICSENHSMISNRKHCITIVIDLSKQQY